MAWMWLSVSIAMRTRRLPTSLWKWPTDIRGQRSKAPPMTKPDLMAELAEAWIVDLAPGVERPDEYSPVIVDNLRAAEYWAKQKDWIVTPLVRADRAVDSERIDYL